MPALTYSGSWDIDPLCRLQLREKRALKGEVEMFGASGSEVPLDLLQKESYVVVESWFLPHRPVDYVSALLRSAYHQELLSFL